VRRVLDGFPGAAPPHVTVRAVVRLERLLAMALFLGNRRRVLAREVATEFAVSLRTVYRDMRALTAAGFPVEGNAGDGYRLAQDAFLRPLALTAAEAEALSLAAAALAATTPPALRDALTRAAVKLNAVVDTPTRRQLSQLQKQIVVPPFARATLGPTPELLSALRDRQVARIHYRDTRSGARSQRDIEPLGLVCLGEAWWLIAYCRLRRDARAFRLDRIERWRSLPGHFAPRPRFSLSEIIARDSHLARSLFGY
jgi:predicted DNA-binding transcriptional regulator YafY